MSNLIEYIKKQRAAGLDDYQILKNTNRTVSTRQTGGHFRPIENDESGRPLVYAEFDDTNRDDRTGIFFNSTEKVFYQIDPESGAPLELDFDYPQDKAVTDEGVNLFDIDVGHTDYEEEPDAGIGIPAADIPGADLSGGPLDIDEMFDPDGDPMPMETDSTSADSYVTIGRGEILFHPSADVRTISSGTMIFVKLPKILDMSKQRSFTMFFTPSREYARRFAGIQSLDKRDVYVHELRAVVPIPNIKRVDSNLVSESIDNINLGKGFCGPSIDGDINGIQLVYRTANEGTVEEFYICNPERFFEIVSTEMQIDATNWVDISESSRKQMHVESVQKSANVTEFDEELPAETSGAADDIPLGDMPPDVSFSDVKEAALEDAARGDASFEERGFEDAARGDASFEERGFEERGFEGTGLEDVGSGDPDLGFA
jgi:hypothetical protein